MRRLRFRDLVERHQLCHFGITRLDAAGAIHTHDFYELFWVESGHGQHLLNGVHHELHAGTLTLIRPSDRHGLVGSANEKLVIANIAFPSIHWRSIFRRYWNGTPDPFVAAAAARVYVLTGIAWSQLQSAADPISKGDWSMLALDRFLLTLVPLLQASRSDDETSSIPDYLRLAVREVAHPIRLRQGTGALVEIAGRSPEHISRLVRKHYGKTPTELVNEMRLEHAARQLAQSIDPIADIAEECGLPNLSHFYRLFRTRYSMTPQEYRSRQQLTVRG